MPSLEETIRRRAYELWESQGCPEGEADQFWYLAEREVMATDAPAAAAAEAPQPATRRQAARSTGTDAEEKKARSKARSPATAAGEGDKSADPGPTKARSRSGEAPAKKAAGTAGRTTTRGRKAPRGNPPATTGET